jgi:hypothetical protein
MRGHPEEHVLEIVERRDINQLATLYEGIEERNKASGKHSNNWVTWISSF